MPDSGAPHPPTELDEAWHVHLFALGLVEFESHSVPDSGAVTAFGGRLELFVALRPWFALGASGSYAPPIFLGWTPASLRNDCSAGACVPPPAGLVRGMLESRFAWAVVPSRVDLWSGLSAGVGELTEVDQSPGVVVQAAAGVDVRIADVIWLALSQRLLAQDVGGLGLYSGWLLGTGIDVGIRIGGVTTN
jgi:hypothetical protein